jgi:ribonuclease T1
VYGLILQGGPFQHEKDGTTFGNYERQLPRARRGYYREYTVDTPGARNRGTRRIVCGGRQPTAPDACYYTGDHYSSFRKIVP